MRIFSIVDARSDKVELEIMEKYVSIEKGGQYLICNNPSIDDSEKFIVLKSLNG